MSVKLFITGAGALVLGIIAGAATSGGEQQVFYQGGLTYV